MKKILVLLLIIPFFYGCGTVPGAAGTKAEIESFMKKQVDAWNKGDLEGFMECYWKSEKMTFQSGSGKRLHGWKQLLNMYKTNYSGENRGTLDFVDLEINVVTADVVYVLGRWKVTLKDSVKQGLFTLLWQKLPEGWRIINDHSS
ncbi:MAG: DUF3225 domain-containing protein [Candidatus Aminicenantes bacterium]|nr:DUF3225 domain-containing protein [Candidatus Aminicenantes bacterium]